MVEKRLQEQETSLSPTRTATHKRLKKEAEAHAHYIQMTYGPMICEAAETVAALGETMQPLLETVQAAAEPLAQMQEQLASLSLPVIDVDAFNGIADYLSLVTTMPRPLPIIQKSPEPVRYVPESESRPVVVHVELTDEHCKKIGNSIATTLLENNALVHVYTTTAQIDLEYDHKARTVSRIIGTREYKSRFDGQDDNKRRDTFEWLVRARRARRLLDVKKLKEDLGCPSITAVYKVIQGLNKKLNDDLYVVVNFADGSDKLGYHMHDSIAVHEI
jgi:hypothetical protein